jgi:hypothetical protein
MKTVTNPRGKPVTSYDQTLIFAPLSLGAIERLEEKLPQFNTGKVKVGEIIDIAHDSLKRNYPEITREQVGDFVDGGNTQEVFQAIMEASGMATSDGKAEGAGGKGEQTGGS